MKNPNESRINSLMEELGSVFLFISIIFLALIVSPFFHEGYNEAGDTHFHSSVVHHMSRLIQEEKTIFGWFNMFQVGEPLFYYYQPLYYILSALIHVATGLGVVFSEKIFLCSLILAYPVTVYYFLRKIGFHNPIAGLASLFYVTSNAGWGNNITSYFHVGIVTQAVGMVLFPIILGVFIEAFLKNKRIRLLLLLLVLSMLAHTLVNFTTWLVINMMLVLIILRSGGDLTVFLVRKYLLMLGLFILLASFWLIPFFSLVEYKGTESMLRYGDYIAGYQRSSFSLDQLINYFLDGSLLDEPDDFLVRRNWFDNRGNHRLPLLTLFTLIGFIYAIFRQNRIGESIIVVGFLGSFLYLAGADDIPILGYVPLQNQMFFIRVMPVFEFFCICLAGYGLFRLANSIPEWLERSKGKKEGLDKNSFICIIILSILVFSPLLYERYLSSKEMIGAGEHQLSMEVKELFEKADYDQKGRLYVGRSLYHLNNEVQTHFAIQSNLPTIMTPNWQQHLAQQFLIRVVPTGEFTFESSRKALPYNPHLMDVYNVKYIVSNARWEASSLRSEFKSNLTLLSSTKNYRFYEVEGKHSYFKFIERRPILAVASDDSWFNLGLHWMLLNQNHYSGFELPFIVHSPTQVLEELELNPDKYPAILLFDFESEDQEGGLSRLKRYVSEGGEIISPYEFEDLETTSVNLFRNGVFMHVGIPLTELFQGKTRSIKEENSLQSYKASYESDSLRFVVAKTSFFPVWDTRIDGERVEILPVTPHLVGFWVPAGKHDLSLDYEVKHPIPPFLLMIVGIILLVFFERKNYFIFNKEPVLDSKKIPKLQLALIVVLFGTLSFLYLLESAGDMPAAKMPNFLDEYSQYHIPLDWYPVYEEDVFYEVQVSESLFSFNKKVYSKNVSLSKEFVEVDDLKPGKIYYWRVRVHKPGKAGIWSIPAAFRTFKNAPHIHKLYIQEKNISST